MQHGFTLSLPRGASTAFASCDAPGPVPQGGGRFWAAPSSPLHNPAPGIWLVGKVFARDDHQAGSTDPVWNHLPRDLVARAAWLLSRCWGAFAAILREEPDGPYYLLTDPSGLFPVYRYCSTTHTHLLTHARYLSAILGHEPQVCFGALARFLLRPELRLRRTCLAGLEQVPPGTLCSLDGRGSEVPLWKPDTFMPGAALPDFEEAADGLRAVSRSVIATWSQVFGKVGVAASGGVDSSLVCGALAATRADYACVTLATSDPSGDETAHVRQLARHLGVEWIEFLYDEALFDPARPASMGLPSPRRRSFLAVTDALLARAANQLDAAVVFDGNGGDSLFCYLHSAMPVVDRLRNRAATPGVGSVLLDMCRVTGCDIPTMLRAVARKLFVPPRNALWPEERDLLELGCGQDSIPPLVPWLDADVGSHPGKRTHLTLLMQAQNQLHGLTEGLPRFSPLMSQPLLEYCLSIPTWLWPQGGINRALARHAFRPELPRAVMKRSSKAGPDSFLRALFARHRSTIRDMLLDGLLARHDLLDRSAIEDALEIDSHAAGELVYRLLDLAEAEAWAQSWHA